MTLNKKQAVVDVIDPKKDVTLKAGSKLNNKLSGSNKMTTEQQALRQNPAIVDQSTMTTLVDIHFKSISAAAQFVQGCATNGYRFFGLNQSTTTTAAATNATTTTKKTTKKATQSTAEEEKKDETEVDNNINLQPEETPAETTKEETPAITQKEKIEIIDKINNFLLEFNVRFKTSRQLDAIARQDDPTAYMLNTYVLQGYPEEVTEAIEKKTHSEEWQEIVKSLQKVKKELAEKDPDNQHAINRRLIIYFGPAGSGKTTAAERRFKDAKTIVCNASLDPAELYVKFDPDTKTLKKTELAEAMESGSKIILDEIGLLNVDCMTSLQGVTDNKKSITVYGIEITIKEGFAIVATMNHETNLDKYPLPEPLVTRAAELNLLDVNSSDKIATQIWNF